MKKKLFLLSVIFLITLLFFNCEQPSSSSGGGGGGEDGGTAVTFVSAVQTGGTWGTADSTGLTLTFSVDPTTLTADNITLTGATKGALSGSGTTRSLTISSITVGNGETVSVAITNPSGYSISKSPRYAEVYKLYLLRDTGPAGGLIFYDKGSYSDGWRFLEAAPQSTEWTSKQWGKYGTMVNGTETAIGTGKNNTALILAVLNASPADSDRAAQLTDALSYGGYDDWFLPSKDELNEMCWVLHSRRWNGISTEDNPAYGTNRVGGFANDYYWSSSESSRNYACLQYFDNGINYSLDKNLSLRVRAVRAF